GPRTLRSGPSRADTGSGRRPQTGGFTRGYIDLVGRGVIVRLGDEFGPGLEVDAVVADVSAIDTSKRLAGRQKDIESLPAFTSIQPTDAKEAVRQRYLADRASPEHSTLRQAVGLDLIVR